MTDEEIQKEAEKFGLAFYDCVEYQEDVADALEQAYIAGAKENGVVWHDLRKNPDDLPKDIREVLDQNGDKCWYDTPHTNRWKRFLNYQGKDVAFANDVIAWCEIPKFEVGQ